MRFVIHHRNCSVFVLIALHFRICSTIFSPAHKDKDCGGLRNIGKVICHVFFVDEILETDGRNSVSLTLQWKEGPFHWPPSFKFKMSA